MSRYNFSDIMIELIELSREIMTDIRCQLNYYRASVYKIEMASNINKKIHQLQLVIKLLGNESLLEPIKDYEATEINYNTKAIPGECLFSSRCITLLGALEKLLDKHFNSIFNSGDPDSPTQFACNISKHRQELLSICRHGSRQWDFFKTLSY